MEITEKTWVEYITRLARLNAAAGQKMAEYVAKYGAADTNALIEYACALAQKYGEGSAELACQMYDAVAEASGAAVPPAQPAAPATYGETAKMVNATKESPPLLQSGVSRLVKQAAADTTLQNAARDGAEWAWVPHGDTCAFCAMLASNGWQRAGKKTLRGEHARHIHANCDCEYAVRFNGDTNVAGYGHVDPADLRADIFKVGHHGQKDGADEALLRAVRPKAVVCCASSDRRYNSAHPDLMRTIAAGGAALYFSDCPSLPEEMEPAPPHGALTFTLEPEGAFTACYEPPAMEG